MSHLLVVLLRRSGCLVAMGPSLCRGVVVTRVRYFGDLFNEKIKNGGLLVHREPLFCADKPSLPGGLNDSARRRQLPGTDLQPARITTTAADFSRSAHMLDRSSDSSKSHA